MEPLILRRMKENPLKNLPVKNIYLCREEMPRYQSEIYCAVLEKYRRGGFSSPLNFINKLREVSLHPDLGTLSEEKIFKLDTGEVINRSARLIKTNQAIDRVYRIGQEKSVNVYLPLACNKNLRGKTFDENLELLLSYKKNLSAKVLFSTAETDNDLNILISMLSLYGEEAAHWTIEEVDEITGLVFERIICDLYNVMKNFTAIKTPDTNDFGADVVVTNVQNFTSGSIKIAETTHVKLISRRELKDLFATNKILKCA